MREQNTFIVMFYYFSFRILSFNILVNACSLALHHLMARILYQSDDIYFYNAEIDHKHFETGSSSPISSADTFPHLTYFVDAHKSIQIRYSIHSMAKALIQNQIPRNLLKLKYHILDIIICDIIYSIQELISTVYY